MRIPYLLLIVIVAGPVLAWLLGSRSSLDPAIEKHITLSHQQLSDASVSQIASLGDLLIVDDDVIIDAELIQSWFAELQGQYGTYYYQSDSVGQFTVLASDSQGDFHLGRHYLEGYAPFSVDNPWLPWQVLAKKKRYQLDQDQYAGHVEVWQSSRQSYFYPSGDCEDHAILLADWLISSGYDARVVLGDYDGGGHAWVVLFEQGQQYILEATQKRGISKKLPLAASFTRYHPELMFNREHFWHNTGSKFTNDYRSSNWVLKSRLIL